MTLRSLAGTLPNAAGCTGPGLSAFVALPLPGDVGVSATDAARSAGATALDLPGGSGELVTIAPLSLVVVRSVGARRWFLLAGLVVPEVLERAAAELSVRPRGRPVIRTRGLTKRFGPVVAVDSVDLRVDEGDRYGFLGPNGSGKTTLVRMLLGLVFSTGGEIKIMGQPIPRRARVLPEGGSLIEEPAAYGHLSCRRNLALMDAAGPDRSRRHRRHLTPGQRASSAFLGCRAATVSSAARGLSIMCVARTATSPRTYGGRRIET
jgi:ABC transporter